MEKWVLKFLVMFGLAFGKAYSSVKNGYDRVSIDCGNRSAWNPSFSVGNTWRSDENYIKTGENKLISTTKLPEVMRTLRLFPEGNKNCYDLPLISQQKFLLRAGFYYGNYDGLFKPPSFDLQFDDNLWANVSTSLSEEPIFYEAIYRTKEKNSLKVCLVRTQEGEIPFISSLEATQLPDDFYRLMENNTALNLHSRIHFGGDSDIGQLSEITDDIYNRIWKLRVLPDYNNITSDFVPYGQSSYTENAVPYAALADAIVPPNGNDSISMFIDLPMRTELSAYFIFYFKEPSQRWKTKPIRKIEIYIDGQLKNVTEVPQDERYQVVSVYPVTVVGPANVTISPTEGSAMPPILNVMEVFTANEVSKAGASHYYSSLFLIFFHILVLVILSF